MLGVDINVGFSNTKEFLDSLVKELDLASAAFVFEEGKSNKSFSLMIRNKSNLIKLVYFGEEDKNKSLIGEILPEIKAMIESQKW